RCIGGKTSLYGDDFASHGGYRGAYRRTVGEVLALDPFRNSNTSREILPDGPPIHGPRALIVIKFDPDKFHCRRGSRARKVPDYVARSRLTTYDPPFDLKSQNWIIH